MSLLQEDSVHVNFSFLRKRELRVRVSNTTNGGQDWRAAAALFSSAVPKGGCSVLVKSQSCRRETWQGTPGALSYILDIYDNTLCYDIYFVLYFLGFFLLATSETEFWSRWAL